MVQKLVLVVLASTVVQLAAAADPYTFTPEDYIEYGIYFSARGSTTSSRGKLLTLRYGDIEGYYAAVIPEAREVPTPKQLLRLRTARGTVRVDRSDNSGVSVTRDTYNDVRRSGTKRLEIRFDNGVCTDREGLTSACIVDLLLITDGPDKGVVRSPRTLTITTSTGLSFRYRSIRTDGGKPLNLPLLRRTPTINNYAWEWRPAVDR
jgi:hypothetical protein